MDQLVKKAPLIQYARNRKGQRVGIAVAYLSNRGQIKVGYSKCNKTDRFDRTAGLNVAMQRAVSVDEVGFDEVPHALIDPLASIVNRSQLYFKQTLIESKSKRKTRKKK